MKLLPFSGKFRALYIVESRLRIIELIKDELDSPAGVDYRCFLGRGGRYKRLLGGTRQGPLHQESEVHPRRGTHQVTE